MPATTPTTPDTRYLGGRAPQDGEVWQEADGTCLLHDRGHWLGIGTPLRVQPVAFPLRPLLTADGEIDPKRLEVETRR